MHALFVVPYAMETTLRFVRAANRLPGVRLGIVTQQKRAAFGDAVGEETPIERVEDPLDADQLETAVRRAGKALGGRVDRLIGVLEQLQEPMAEVRERCSIRGMDVAEARRFRDKSLMKDRLREHGLPCARHHLAQSAASALSFARECLPLVAKPPAGAGARNTARIESLEELESYVRTLPPSAERPLLLEEFITGKEHSFDTVTLGGRHLLHSISRYTPTPLEVMENPLLQWCVVLPRHIDGDEYDDIYELGPRALDALGMVTGMTHMEWFRRPDGSLAISEVAARPPGAQFTSLISYAHDLDFYAAWARLMILEEFETPQRDWAVGAVYLRGHGSGEVKRVTGLEQAQQELASLVVQAKIPKVGQPKANDYEGEGFVILRHPETEAVTAGLRRVLELIRVELA